MDYLDMVNELYLAISEMGANEDSFTYELLGVGITSSSADSIAGFLGSPMRWVHKLYSNRLLVQKMLMPSRMMLQQMMVQI